MKTKSRQIVRLDGRCVVCAGSGRNGTHQGKPCFHCGGSGMSTKPRE